VALFLVVTTPFDTYRRGTIISDPNTVASVRASEKASLVVLVSDEVILPPVAPPDLDLSELQVAYQQLAQQTAATQSALAAILGVNSQQTSALQAQSAQIADLSASLNALAAKVSNPTGGTPTPANLADDLPLAENDGIVLVTDRGAALVGDIR
jgi:hypothetical protein